MVNTNEIKQQVLQWYRLRGLSFRLHLLRGFRKRSNSKLERIFFLKHIIALRKELKFFKNASTSF